MPIIKIDTFHFGIARVNDKIEHTFHFTNKSGDEWKIHGHGFEGQPFYLETKLDAPTTMLPGAHGKLCILFNPQFAMRAHYVINIWLQEDLTSYLSFEISGEVVQ